MLVRTAASLAVCVVGTLGFASAAQAATAALVEFAIGNPSAIDAAGSSRALAKGAAVQAGDTIDTGTGRVQLRFSDGAYVSLQPGSQFRIDEYNYNGKNDETERGFFSLIKGGLRTITGLVGRSNRRNYQVRVPVATIGIRGTEYTLLFDGKALGSVGEGEIAVCNSGGCLNVGSGQAYVVADANTKPEITSAQSFLPPPPPPSTIGRHSADQPGNPADPNGDFSGVLISGNNVTEEGLPAALLPSLPVTTIDNTHQLLFGDQITSGSPVTMQDVVLALGIQSFPAVSSIEEGTFARRTSADVQNGRLESWVDIGPNNGTSTRGTATVASDWGNVGSIAWGRLTSGTLADGSPSGRSPGDFAGTVLTATDNLHYVVGKLPPPSALTGTHAFTTLIGATTPTGPTATSQLVTTGPDRPSLSVDFTTGAVRAQVSVVGPANARVTFNGSTIFDGFRFAASGTARGTGCTASCGGDFAGTFAGAQAQYAGFTYSIQGTTFGSAQGAVVLGKNP